MVKYILTTCFLVIFCLYSTQIQAQDVLIPQKSISLSYFGELITNSGIRLGFATSLTQKIKEKRNLKTIQKAWVVSGYITYYRHVRNHKGLMLTAAIGRQRLTDSGFQSAINFEAGFMRSMLDGEVYSWDGEKIVEGNKGSSHWVLVPITL